MTLNDPNPNFKGTPLIGVDCLRNCRRQRHSYNGIQILY